MYPANRILPCLAAAMTLGCGIGAFAQPVQTLEGTCPGPMRAEITGARPRKGLALLYASRAGSLTIPWHHGCGGVELGLRWPVHGIASTVADESGFAFFEGVAGPAACGGYLQTLNAPSGGCETSNVVQIP